jgi:hypothetical protein
MTLTSYHTTSASSSVPSYSDVALAVFWMLPLFCCCLNALQEGFTLNLGFVLATLNHVYEYMSELSHFRTIVAAHLLGHNRSH